MECCRGEHLEVSPKEASNPAWLGQRVEEFRSDEGGIVGSQAEEAVVKNHLGAACGPQSSAQVETDSGGLANHRHSASEICISVCINRNSW